MRQIIVTEFLTLDGVMEAPGGGDSPHAGWTFKDIEFVPEAYAIKGSEMMESTAMLLGRKSYQEFAPVWPSMDEFAHYNAIPRYVVSTTLTECDLGWPAAILRSTDDVAQLKQTDGGPIIVHGSATLAQSLADAGLIDRYHLLTFPVILGSGKRLFTEAQRKQKLQLVNHDAYRNGIVLSVYDVVH